MLKKLCFLVVLASVPVTEAAADLSLWMKLNEPHHFAIMRHGIAPGTGDPENFKIGDCSTQRNLNDDGREQSKTIGATARTSGLMKAKVYSSEWCRCMDTARLLELGPVLPLPALNSFYQRYEDKDKNIEALMDFLRKHRNNNMPIILVTHQVTISALTGQFARQGETLIFRVTGGNAIEMVGTIPPE